MCKQCETNPVYEFTNKRKLCKTCFVHYFEKKVLYTIRKFGLIKQREIIGYKKASDFKSVVLDRILTFISEKSEITLVKIPNKKVKKIAVNSSLDSESERIIKILIGGKSEGLEKCFSIEKNMIKPLYLFLDEEILLYAKLKNLKFTEKKKKKSKIANFLGELEKKHPEVKRATVNSILELYKNNYFFCLSINLCINILVCSFSLFISFII